MANHEACQVYMEQQIDEGLKEGKTPYSIGKEISKWVEKLFEAKIPHRTIEQRARRINATNVAKTSPRVEPTTASVEEPGQDAGYKLALKALEKAVRVARRGKYESTSKESILKDIEALRNIVDPKTKQTKRQIALQEDFWNADHVISERAAFHIQNSNIGDQMRNGDKIFTVPRIIDIEGSRSFLSVLVVTERNLRGAHSQ